MPPSTAGGDACRYIGMKLQSRNQSRVPSLKKSIETAGFVGKVRAVE
jgi:hypothetical protein